MPLRPGSPRLAAVVLAAAGLVVPGLAGCSQSSSAGDRVDVAEQGYVSGDGSTTILAEADRTPAPDLRGTTLQGEPFVLADHLGEVVVLNTWASWCAPCRAEAPALEATSRELAGRGVTLVGLNTRDSAAAAQAFVRRFDISYPSVADPDGSLQLLFHDTLPPSAIPTTVVIDQKGRVAARALGEVDRSRLLGLVEPILAEGSA